MGTNLGQNSVYVHIRPLSPERLERDSKANERLVRADSLVNAIQRKDFDEAFKIASEIEKDRAAHYPMLLRATKLTSVELREINKIIDEATKHAKPDLYKNKSSVELMERLFDLEQQYLKTTIDKFNKLNDKAGQKVLDEQLKEIGQEQSALVIEIKNNPARWSELSEQADKPMLAGMKLSEIQAALKQGNLSRKVMGEALDRVGKIERRVTDGDSHGREISRNRGTSH